jgi:hypothetical protein
MQADSGSARENRAAPGVSRRQFSATPQALEGA